MKKISPFTPRSAAVFKYFGFTILCTKLKKWSEHHRMYYWLRMGLYVVWTLCTNGKTYFLWPKLMICWKSLCTEKIWTETLRSNEDWTWQVKTSRNSLNKKEINKKAPTWRVLRNFLIHIYFYVHRYFWRSHQ